jgi:hypothetical protein
MYVLFAIIINLNKQGKTMSKKHFYYLCTILLVSNIVCNADENSQLEALRQAAMSEIAQPENVDAKEEIFNSGALGLQSLNPEISVVGDMLWRYNNSDSTDQKSDFNFRTLGIHFGAYLDPYTRFKAAVGINENEAELGEAYITRFGIVPHINLTLGKFRQQFGVVNRWHKHALDQVDFPLALQQIFGPGGLNQTGASVAWIIPELSGFLQELTIQITDGNSPRVFAENDKNNIAALGHYRVYRDLSDSTYAELGFTGLYGKNNKWTIGEDIIDKDLDTFVFGADFTLMWEPTTRMRYHNFTWRTETYALNKDIMAPDGSGEDTLNAWGLYSYIQGKVSRTIILGARYDYFKPDTKTYAEEDTANIAPLAVTVDGADRWQIGPYITWNQSPFVHFRAEYDHQDGSGTGPKADIFWLQCIFAAGPHKHDRY